MNKGVIVGGCRSNCLLLSDDMLLLASLEQTLHTC